MWWCMPVIQLQCRDGLHCADMICARADDQKARPIGERADLGQDGEKDENSKR